MRGYNTGQFVHLVLIYGGRVGFLDNSHPINELIFEAQRLRQKTEYSVNTPHY